MATHPPEIFCLLCNCQAKVLGHVSDPTTLAELGDLFDQKKSPRPYYLIDCPNCGEQIQEKA